LPAAFALACLEVSMAGAAGSVASRNVSIGSDVLACTAACGLAPPAALFAGTLPFLLSLITDLTGPAGC
jgi:hypothetical protein